MSLEDNYESLYPGDIAILNPVKKDTPARKIFLYTAPRGRWFEDNEDWKVSGTFEAGEIACILQSITFQGVITEICEVEVLTARGCRGWCWGDMLKKVRCN